jgi:hypothetical protein
MANDYKMPSHEDIQAAIAEGRRLRAEYISNAIRNGFRTLRALPSQISSRLHRPAHG